MKFAKIVELEYSHQIKGKKREVMDILINSMGGESFHNVDIYQIITFYTLNITQFCQLYLNKA